MHFKRSLTARIAAALLLFAAAATRADDAGAPPSGLWQARDGGDKIAIEFLDQGRMRMLVQMSDAMRKALPGMPADKRALIEKSRTKVQGQDWLALPGVWSAQGAGRVHVHIDMTGAPKPLDTDFVYHLESADVLDGKFDTDANAKRYQRIAP